MRSKLTWKTKQWSTGCLVGPLPIVFRDAENNKVSLRSVIGDELARIVEAHASILLDMRDQPIMQDIKRTLRAIAELPKAADISRLDAQTDAYMLGAAHRLFGQVDLAKLTHSQRAECAADALKKLPSIDGRPAGLDPIVVEMVRELLAHMPKANPTARKALVGIALMACGVGSGEKNIERLIREAG